MKKQRKRKYQYKVSEVEVQEALWRWYEIVNYSYNRQLQLDAFVGAYNVYNNQWGWFANEKGYRRLQMVLSPHCITLLKAYALRYNKKTLWQRLQG